MAFFSRVTLSWKKTSRLHRLERSIAPPNRSVLEVASDLGQLLAHGEKGPRGRALEEFFDLCEADESVRQVMEREDLSRFDLKGIAVRLLARGLGEWIQGHYVALSTIAYAEPLHYFICAERRGVSRQQIFFDLVEYWEGRITDRKLLQQIPSEHMPAGTEIQNFGEEPTDARQRTPSGAGAY